MDFPTVLNTIEIPSYKYGIQLIQYGVKYTKTSELVAWNCKSFTYGFLGFRPTDHRDMKLQSNTSYMAVTKSSNS